MRKLIEVVVVVVVVVVLSVVCGVEVVVVHDA